jgi:Ca2+-binding RTX toxin-like protein
VLTAEHLTDVPSNHVKTCFRAQIAACPKAHGRTIFGSDRGDRLAGTRGFDVISSGAGDDQIDLRSGGRDRVRCGGGEDLVRLRPGDGDDRVGASCERIRRS